MDLLRSNNATPGSDVNNGPIAAAGRGEATAEPPAEPTTDPPIEPDRRELMSRAIGEWCGQLIDIGGRNTLLYFKDLKVGTLDLSRAEPSSLDGLLDGRTKRLSELFTDPREAEGAARRGRAINAKAKENFEERGLRTLSLGLGMATWLNARGTATPAAPILLRSLTLQPRSGGEEDFDVALMDDWEVNPTLLHLLTTNYSLALDADDLLAVAVDREGRLDQASLYASFTEAAREIPGWAIEDRVIVANFSYAKMPMVADLGSSIDALLEHPLICALAGSAEDRAAIRATQISLGEAVDEAFADRQEPRDEFLVLDADASQCRVVNLAIAGANLVVQGPPGTGKSQTIANLIATLVARGRSVLFVAEKRAAIDAVLGRLTDVGLQDLLLDLHAGTGSRKRLAADLGRALQAMGSVPPIDVTQMQADLRSHRDELNRHASALHETRSPGNKSAYELQAMVIGASPAHRSDQLLSASTLQTLDADALVASRNQIAEWVSRDGPAIASGLREWSGAFGHVTTTEQVQRLQESVAGLRNSMIPATSARLETTLSDCGLEPPNSLDDYDPLLSLLEGVRETLTTFHTSIFSCDLPTLIRDLRPAERNPISRAWNAMMSKKYRDAKRVAASLAATNLRPAECLTVLRRAKEQRETWSARASDSGAPRLPANLDAALAGLEQLRGELDALGAALGDTMTGANIPTIVDHLDALTRDFGTLQRLPTLTEVHRSLTARGLGPLVDEISRRGLDDGAARDCLDFVWAQSVLNAIAAGDPRIGGFDGTNHSRVAREFLARDQEQIAAAARRVRRASAEAAVASRNAEPDQSDLLEKNSRLKRRHGSIRDLLQQAPDVLLAVRPCWVMSPLVVSQLLPSDRTYFDVVVFDEASQIKPADAIPALARGKQAIVAGDSKQLPPTAFFNVSAADGDDDGTAAPWTKDMDSILDSLSVLLPNTQGSTTLNWHYRSRDERLIAFSNAQPELYDWSLTTFPGAVGDGCLRHVLIPHRPGIGGTTDSSTDEVAAVVQLVREHAVQRPGESLGVIAMGIKHSDRIAETLRLARRDDKALDQFMDEGAEEPFFVKNLERVQGDERDAVILTIGYPKSPDGRMQYRFGPLNNEGGERRLNVAITRARNRMTVVSAFAPEDMDDDRLTKEGSQMLKRYLAYAQSGGTDLGRHSMPKPSLNGFELDVKNRLTTAGIPLQAQYGVAGFWIDFAAQHPTKAGKMVLAIEADGASYHSSTTARQRDRLRQTHLERLGWRFHRIWSTDWFRDPDSEVAKAVNAYKTAVAESEHPTQAPAAAPDPRRDPTPVTAGTPLRATARPQIPSGLKIGEYTDRDLDTIVRWIKSDDLLRTDADLLEETMRELGFLRKGTQIRSRINDAVNRARK